MSLIQQLRAWWTPEPEPVPRKTGADAVWHFIELESQRFESQGADPFTFEEKWRFFIRFMMNSSHGSDAVLSAIQDIYAPRQEQASEWRRLNFLRHSLEHHARRFPVHAP